jgi:hypothetical protein
VNDTAEFVGQIPGPAKESLIEIHPQATLGDQSLNINPANDTIFFDCNSPTSNHEDNVSTDSNGPEVESLKLYRDLSKGHPRF